MIWRWIAKNNKIETAMEKLRNKLLLRCVLKGREREHTRRSKRRPRNDEKVARAQKAEEKRLIY
jgi:hypothetical protein